jgi:transposase
MIAVDGNGMPIATTTESATPHEVKLIEPLLATVRIPSGKRGRPKKRLGRLIYDKAADDDSLRKRLHKRGTELICPHRNNRKKPKLQDGRKLRRYRKRWKIERTNAWLQNFRRLVVRYDRLDAMFEAQIQIANILITMRRL